MQYFFLYIFHLFHNTYKIKIFSKTGLNIHARQTLTTNAAQTYRYIEICIYNWQLVRKLNK